MRGDGPHDEEGVMPENEFELYLSLLSRFLRLNPAQRDGIADELRDHLEQRLEELSARGLSREQAIQSALEEFGDAAELAQHFTRAAHVRRRRIIMRYTYGTAAALAAGILVAAAFWPESSPGPIRMPMPNRVIAQEAGSGLGGPGGMAAPATAPVAPLTDEEETRNAALEAKLRNPVETNFIEMTLGDAIEYLHETYQIPLIIDRAAIQNAEQTLDQMINLKVSNVQARTALELILEWGNLGYTIRDGILMITTADLAHEIKVYNVRDLLTSDSEGGSGAGSTVSAPGMMGGGMGMGPTGMGAMMGSGGGMRPTAKKGAASAGMAGMGMAGSMGNPAGPMGGAGPAAPVVHQTASLARVISTTVAPDSWTDLGGAGSIIEYNGLLIVKNSHAVHGKVRKLLDTMRVSLHQLDGAGGGMGGSAGMMGGGGMGGPAGFMGGWRGTGPGAAGGGGNPGQ